MTLTHLTDATGGPRPAVRIEGDLVHLDLVVQHPEAAALIRAQLEKAGPEVAADVVRRALPIGLVSLQMSSTVMDSGAVARTLDHYTSAIGNRTDAAMNELETTLGRLRQGEQDVVQVANRILERLPERLDAALAGQSESVRSAMTEAARSIIDVGLQQVSVLVGQHTATVTRELSLEEGGPLHALRRDLAAQSENARREVTTLLTNLVAQLEADRSARLAGAKSSRAIGDAAEGDLMALCDKIVTGAGDQFEATGNQAGANGRRNGDGVATLNPLITGTSRTLRIALEAKTRTRPLSVQALMAEANAACVTREADGALIIVPTRDEVPGESSVYRLDATHWVVSADDAAEAAGWSYLWLREAVALTARRVEGKDGVDLAQVEARINAALRSIESLDEVEKSAYLARRNIDKVITANKETQERTRESLAEGLAALRA